MERLVFDLESGAAPPRPPVLVGVVASGNLEVLVEHAGSARCHVDVSTSAVGFGDVWRAVLEDFAARHPVGGLALSLNDAGATPAVVTLRLAQALEEYLGRAP